MKESNLRRLGLALEEARAAYQAECAEPYDSVNFRCSTCGSRWPGHECPGPAVAYWVDHLAGPVPSPVHLCTVCGGRHDAEFVNLRAALDERNRAIEEIRAERDRWRERDALARQEILALNNMLEAGKGRVRKLAKVIESGRALVEGMESPVSRIRGNDRDLVQTFHRRLAETIKIPPDTYAS